VWESRPVVYAFDGMRLDVDRYELTRDDSAVPMEPQVFDVLAYLVLHRERVVSKEELMDNVWGGRFVSETAVTSRIKQARRAIGDDGQAQRLIKTVHGRGYRFVADVSRTEVSASSGAAAVAGAPGVHDELPPVTYAESDDLQIAYQITGQGPPDIVLVPGFISHLDQDWGDPHHTHFLQRLGQMGRLIRFDKRGTGMSDRPQGLPDLETRMHDVLAVMDSAASQRAVLFGYSEGGPMATLFAAAHPERVAGLVLYGAYAKRTRAEGYPWVETVEERAAYTDRLVTQWDWEADMRRRCPSADDAMAAWWARRARAATTPSTLRALMDMNALVDVRDVLPAIAVPTLVVHRAGDEMVAVDNGRYLASHIPGAEFVELPGEDHFVSGDPDQILDALEDFVADAASAQAPGRSLAALVGLARDGAESLAAALVAQGGAMRQGPQRAVLVSFDGPATALRALGSRHARGLVASAGVGVAIDEVARDTAYVSGHGVDVARLLAREADPGEVLVPGVIKDLLAGSGLTVEAAGERDLVHVGPHKVYRWVRP
jgi:pimeloyl-ACP methyl ester carboxylesterase